MKVIIQSGNHLYKAGQYDKAEMEYRHALEKESGNNIAKYNLTNALYRNKNADAAIAQLDTLIKANPGEKIKLQAYYNSGAIYSRQYEELKLVNKNTASKTADTETTGEKLLEHSIEAYKNTLRLNPLDQQARENLQKALLEQKKNQPKKKKEDDKKKQPQPQQQNPQQNRSKMNQKEAERQLKLLQQKEKEVKERMQQKQTQAGNRPKDW